MDIETRNRSDLKKYFLRNSVPTEGNFSELVDAMLNQKDDGIVKEPGNPLAIEAAGDATSQKKAINFYDSFVDTAAAWVLALNPRSDALDAATNKEGFSVNDSDGNSRLFIDKASGYVGLGTVDPQAPLHVAGGTDGALTGGGFLALGDTAAANLVLDAGAVMARDNGQLSTLDVQPYGGDLLVHGNGTAARKFVVKDDGKVGIGTSSPKEELSVIGVVRGANDVNETKYVEIGHGGSNGYVNRVGAGSLDFRLDGSNKMSIKSDGTVGIGTTITDGYQLNVVGKGQFTGTLDVGGALSVIGNVGIGLGTGTGATARLQVGGGATMPAVGNSAAAGIQFPTNAWGGWGDGAWIADDHDRDFLYGSVPTAGVLRAPVPGADDVQVPAPERTLRWPAPPAGFTAVGDPQPGTGGDVQVVFPAVDEDHLVIIRAQKEHALDMGDPALGTITSHVRLEPSLLVLVRPQSEPQLSLVVAFDELTGAPAGTVEVVDGQPGVYYQFLDDLGAALGRPAYVYQLDEIGNQAGEMNKGVNQLRMGLDFAVARSQVSTGHRGYVAPEPHLVTVGSTALGGTLSVRAKRARTRIEADLSRSAAFPALPLIRFEADTVTAGSVGRIQVIASVMGDRYEPYLGGVVVKQARWGNGGDLVFLTDAVTETTTFEVHVTRPDDAGLPVTRIVPLTLTVEG